MTTLAEVRRDYPQYADLPDKQLADALHQKFYPDMPQSQFYAQLGFKEHQTTNRVPAPAMAANLKKANEGRSGVSKFIYGKEMPAGYYDPQTGKPNLPTSPIDVVTRPIAEGGTLSLGDEAAGVGGGVAQALAGGSFNEGYNRTVEAERGRNRQLAEEHPVLNTALKFVGGVGSAAAGKGAQAVMGLKEASKQAGRAGATMGGISGFGAAEGGPAERAKGAATGIATGYVLGRALPYVASGAGQVFDKAKAFVTGKNSAAQAPIVKSGDIAAQAQGQYAASEAKGVVFPAQDTDALIGQLNTAVKKARMNPGLHPESAGTMDEIRAMAGKDMTLEDLDQLRQFALDAGKSTRPGDVRIADIIRDKIDDFVEQSGQGGELTSARSLWAEAQKTKAIEQAFSKAERATMKAGSGGNFDNAVRQKIDSLLNNRNVSRYWTPDERAVMEGIVKGTTGHNLMRLIGKLSPQGSGLMAFLQGAGAWATGGTSAPLMGVGMAAKAVADNQTSKNIDSLLRVIQAGGKAPPVLTKTLSPAAQQFIEMLLKGGAATAGQAEGRMFSTPQSAPAQ